MMLLRLKSNQKVFTFLQKRKLYLKIKTVSDKFKAKKLKNHRNRWEGTKIIVHTHQDNKPQKVFLFRIVFMTKIQKR